VNVNILIFSVIVIVAATEVYVWSFGTFQYSYV